MTYIRKPVAVLVAAAIMYSILAFFGTTVFAAWMPVTITVDNFNNGSLTFHWNALPGAASAEIIYHRPGTGDTALYQREVVLGQNSHTINNLKADYIYDISVTIYDNADPAAGEVIGRGLQYYLPSITFRASLPQQQSVDIAGGGREIGVDPKIRLSWMRPKMYYDPDNALYPQDDPNVDNGVFIDADSSTVLAYMRDTYNSIYTDNPRNVSSLNYAINISTDSNRLNSGSAQASIMIDQTGGGTYRAYVSGAETTTAVVNGPDSGFYSFELLGRKDDAAVITDVSGTDNILPDNDILPGTVYYMNIRPLYRDSLGANISAVRVGKPSDYNGSRLMGDKSYVSTPIRFQLTKDSANNIYAKIYRINQGSLDLPRLFYQVQASNDDTVPGDWPSLDTLDDSYFSNDFALTIITGIEPNNRVYYKIVVTSEGSEDRLESSIMDYTLSADTDRPPLPTGVAVTNRVLDVKDVTDPSGATRKVKSTDITLSWVKPPNWDDFSYHILLSTSQTDPGTGERDPVYVDGKVWGRMEGYESKYRLVKYIDADSGRIVDTGNRLEFILNAFELFDYDDDPLTPPVLDLDDNGYPTFLIPNTVYYLQMYSTKKEDAGTEDTAKMSDRSVVISFTSLAGAEPDVPLPMNFGMSGNSKQVSGGKTLNYIDLSFGKVLDLNWNSYTDSYDPALYDYNIYYDIFMSSSTNSDSFIPVGTTQDLQGDIVFSGADDPRSAVITARICQFTEDAYLRLLDIMPAEATQSAEDRFGPNLLPNTVYYFVIRTRLVITNKQDALDVTEKKSMFSSLLPVTTIRLEVTPPDDSQRKPLAPTDFGIAVNDDGEQMLSDDSVTFSWTRQQSDVIYQIIRTTSRTYPTAESSEFENDPVYTSFLNDYDPPSGDPSDERAVYLDPANPDQNFPGKFTYDSTTGICTFAVDRGMFPNRLYYFGLKAVRVGTDRRPLAGSPHSAWVSIPVTTSMIESPFMLEAIPGAEIGFFWTDDTPGVTSEDYNILIKGPSDASYKPMSKAQATVIRDPDGRTYYGRITGLKAGTAYDIKVTRGSGSTVYERTGFMTRDSYHELEVKWIGKQLLDIYSGYEIAIMEEGGSEYTTLSGADLEWYIDKNGSILPYYTEETARTVNNDTLYYHARIKSMDVRLPGGIVTKQPLRSNTRYYVKVRAVKTDPVERDLVSYSKYTGPVSIRTEFNQTDYDNEDRENQQEAKFLDRMEELEKGYYWRIAIGSNGVTSVLLKGDRIANAMQNMSGDSFVVDLSNISVNIDRDEIYIPASIVSVMKKTGKSLVIRTDGTELALRPYTFDASFNENVKGILERQEVKELYLRLDLRHNTGSYKELPAGMQPVSAVNSLDIQAMGFSMTYEEMAGLFHDKLYNEESGLVKDALNRLLKTYVGSGAGSADLINQYTANLVGMMEKELSVYIDNIIKTTKLTNTIRDINAFDAPVAARLQVSSTKETLSAYVLYKGSGGWQKATVRASGTTASVDLLKAGAFVILSPDKSVGGIPKGHWAESYIAKITAKYDLEDIFPGMRSNFMPDNRATCSEVILLYEKVIGKSAANTGLDVKTRLKLLGMDDIIHPNSLLRNVNRQQTAAVLARAFAVRRGLNPASLSPTASKAITDEQGIDDKYYLAVYMVVDINVMQLDESGRFRPGETVTRAEAVAAFVKLLELTGDL